MKRYESVKSSLMRINNTNGQFSLARKECLTETEECLKDMQRLNHKYNKITFGLALKSPNTNRMTFYFWTVAPQTQEESQMWNIVLLMLEDRIVTLLTTIRLEVGRDRLQIFLQPSLLCKINTQVTRCRIEAFVLWAIRLVSICWRKTAEADAGRSEHTGQRECATHCLLTRFHQSEGCAAGPLCHIKEIRFKQTNLKLGCRPPCGVWNARFNDEAAYSSLWRLIYSDG